MKPAHSAAGGTGVYFRAQTVNNFDYKYMVHLNMRYISMKNDPIFVKSTELSADFAHPDRSEHGTVTTSYTAIYACCMYTTNHASVLRVASARPTSQ